MKIFDIFSLWKYENNLYLSKILLVGTLDIKLRN